MQKQIQQQDLDQAMIDRHYLLEAITLATKGYGAVSPNPYVGAILVKEGEVIGRGYHQYAGGAHAEVNALQDALDKGHQLEGSTLYVTLEPCCFRGKTGACTDLILKSGIARVVTAMEDPNPAVAGKGHQILQDAGIEVVTHLLLDEGEKLIEVFSHNQRHKKIFVTLKAALSLDGKLATKHRDSQWITGEAARKRAHYYRGLHDLILIGKGTLLVDNPSLTVRYGYKTPAPTRLLMLNDFSGITTDVITQYHFFNTDLAPSLILYDQKNPPDEKIASLLQAQGVQLSALAEITPEAVMEYTFNAGFMSLFIEGGAAIYDAFINADCVDQYLLFYGPKLIGSPQALELWHSSPIEQLQDAPLVTIESVELLEESFLTVARRRR
ncbi:bifunctional diaminohydroxyphosphoribosylaminopyrimidine deaminase/5-amino-6-(5-phosphoribosylamino)uracil reductase RibD [Ignatzschineria cameli]|uniref:Riboflavin biosynthesis protein RibD n=1 Tax=Ignatzschineria cameli TaxID=2182793 RepID=A0A2U2ATL5_9GAMM|nr:bifunctional diaminohydroxyphosphoribosylaminopyrimidine deaminase/5-amino-6-(5-phosphoribosylamino)uracil reductase RibD [Ignatzschineria cameli]PWD88083.1 bifunctional diaminohydroxyphosphoribosylaminopyrimidine deaminase/5-amino-6-(5-phosphoribosylamino)uracil reductase RibD [Ignatzschineria cameli]PWD91114.1 bifunctional diaminohydroxyphosphoribosylaminopyrimidine deaminase/5-amino-6-(5-phosphoribosylamino)uracil reductase RibD [Ignatzschineria cameli]PWD92755.1 bifunctional diaminohydrox